MPVGNAAGISLPPAGASCRRSAGINAEDTDNELAGTPKGRLIAGEPRSLARRATDCFAPACTSPPQSPQTIRAPYLEIDFISQRRIVRLYG
ncbi:hypothetical protein Tdes44962_MAKER07227 [Teratosphaeria destructans]|uniref:Uncharacterized protein n=1 Tax=Teratosphaeria destructans TaxID=418781 RepID=A0A9W7W631_9PEZI|nr:hypothetical protein Tdes44962_MAKER07227 [Teratosphaeria destructans]